MGKVEKDFWPNFLQPLLENAYLHELTSRTTEACKRANETLA